MVTPTRYKPAPGDKELNLKNLVGFFRESPLSFKFGDPKIVRTVIFYERK